MQTVKSYSGIANIKSSDLDAVIKNKINAGFEIVKIKHVPKSTGYHYTLFLAKTINEPVSGIQCQWCENISSNGSDCCDQCVPF